MEYGRDCDESTILQCQQYGDREDLDYRATFWCLGCQVSITAA
jgi:formamidopyrimidine-DNA glycosylase